MQDMTSDICANTYPTTEDLASMTESEKEAAKLNPVTKQLYDIRDGKQYWVAKLADGNCWMTQNLALDLDVNEQGNAVAVSEKGNQVELNSGNTDITGVWNRFAPTKTETEVPAKGKIDYVSARSWDLGEVVLKNPSIDTLCWQQVPVDLAELGYQQGGFDSVFYGYKLTEQCSFSYKDVSGWTSSYSATEMNSINESEKTYDAHYLIGNYYQWNTVIAGLGVKIDEINVDNSDAMSSRPDKFVNAESSICPVNWKLPTSGIGKENALNWPINYRDDFYELYYNYGYPDLKDSGTKDEWLTFDWGGIYTLKDHGDVNLVNNPTYLVIAGQINPGSGTLGLAGSNGAYWSSTVVPDSAKSAFISAIDNLWVAISASRSRERGYSVRCLAR